jgi:pimeloyl-ACP methyl ester carboxylesterase
MATVFVPGIGSDGPETWPAQAGSATLHTPSQPTFLTLDRGLGRGASDHAEQILGAPGGDPLDVVAHSYGGVAALLAAAQSDRVRSLVLFEPACMSVAATEPANETFIATMAPFWARADDDSLPDAEFAGHFLVAFGYERPPLDDDGAIAFGRRLRGCAPAWAFDVDPTVCARVPTLVVTGAWHPIYEEIADALEAAGAGRATIPGTEHRPQDSTDANALLNDFWAELG